MSAGALVLFDIDGTLMRRAGPHHKRALVEAVRIVTGQAGSLEDVETQGMLDCDLLARMLERLPGVNGTQQALLPSLMETAQSCYLSNCPSDLRERVCPGVENLLQGLRDSGAICGIVSGNLSAIGWKKLELAGLRQYFRLGAFADQADTRASLAAAAIESATRQNLIPAGAKISLIGDHPNDIRAARRNTIQAIATATGVCPIEDLVAEKPDILVRDLTELAVRQLW